MTLTEEQRAAIEYAISSLEQCGSEPEDPVVAKILQAMIDSSDHIVEPTKMIGFDLEAARASISHYRIENPSNVDTECALKELIDQANLAEDAVAEIERLRAEKEEAQESLTAAYLLGSHKKAQEMAARIKELEAERAVWIKWLEEERANCIMAYEWQEDLPELDECADADRYRDEARQQLRAEGKIGSSDHSSDVTKKVWQITEERKAAIDRGMRFLAWSNANTNDPETELDLVVLRAMLTEAA